MSPRGVIAAGHRMTAEAGADVLRSGGTAADAAIAAIAMAAVCEPVLCSPGGGGFAMVRDGEDGIVSVIDCFPHTPRRRDPAIADGVHAIDADFGPARQRFEIGPASTATPGLFAGVEALHRRSGTVPLAQLVAPAARAARDGVEVTPFQHHLFSVVAPILTATESARRLFAPDGSLVRAGQTMYNPGLADALEVLASDGVARSAVGRACLDQQAGRGHITADDLAAYQAVERPALTVDVGGEQVHLNPLPAAGGTLVAHTLQQIVSADPLEMATALQATDAARTTAGGDLRRLADLPLRPRGTTHVSVIDASGSACAFTVSNGEGNGELVDGFGFMLNNVLGERDVNPDGSAGWPLDTRLSSMMSPTIVEHARGGTTVLGTGGSNRIRSAISQTVAALCLGGQGLATAVDAPRLHVEGDHLDFEDRYPAAVAERLRSAFPDHRAWPQPDLFFGGVNAVQAGSDDTGTAVADRRRGGVGIVVGP